MEKQKRKAGKRTPDNEQLKICQDCKAACCRYITIFIPQPTDKDDFDNLHWYLCHAGVSVYQDDEKDWAVIIPTDCDMIKRDQTCKIYETRPEACRDYDAAHCENTTASGDYLQYFDKPEELEEYLDQRWRRKRPKRSAGRRSH